METFGPEPCHRRETVSQQIVLQASRLRCSRDGCTTIWTQPRLRMIIVGPAIRCGMHATHRPGRPRPRRMQYEMEAGGMVGQLWECSRGNSAFTKVAE